MRIRFLSKSAFGSKFNVFFVFYPYKLDQKPENKNKMVLVAAKVRYGETGSVAMAFDGDKCKIYNSEDELYSTNNKKKELELVDDGLPF